MSLQSVACGRDTSVTSGKGTGDAEAIAQLNNKDLENTVLDTKVEFSTYLKAIISYIYVSSIVF